jgi:SAM-dependent methyltransferase
VIRVARVLASAEPGGLPTAARACAWCGRPLDATAKRLGGRLRCASCGVATTDPWPTEAELDKAYSGWYRPSSGRFSGIGDAVLRRTRGRLAQRLDQIAPAGPILDVGAGDGALLDALAARGRHAVGLERESTRPDVREGDLGAIDGRWAAIVFWHSLEHLVSPGDELERTADLLEPGGALVIAVPNADSLQAHVFGDRWLALDLPRHLVHVPASALLARVRAIGLTVERVSYWRGGQVLFGWLHGLVGRLPGRPDLYDAIRRPAARREHLRGSTRLMTLVAAVALSPIAALCAGAEIAARRGGTVYVEARRG